MRTSTATRYYALDQQAKSMPTIWRATVDITCSLCEKPIKKGALHSMTRKPNRAALYRVCRECRPFRVTGERSPDID